MFSGKKCGSPEWNRVAAKFKRRGKTNRFNVFQRTLTRVKEYPKGPGFARFAGLQWKTVSQRRQEEIEVLGYSMDRMNKAGRRWKVVRQFRKKQAD